MTKSDKKRKRNDDEDAEAIITDSLAAHGMPSTLAIALTKNNEATHRASLSR